MVRQKNSYMEVLKIALMENKSLLFTAENKTMPPTNGIWKKLEKSMNYKMSSKYIYTIVLQNRHNIRELLTDKDLKVTGILKKDVRENSVEEYIKTGSENFGSNSNSTSNSGNMEITFAGKRVLVTGAGQGIGRGIAKRLAKTGAKVVALGRTKTHLDSLKTEHPSIEIICVDLEDWDKTKEALNNLRHVDALINNAAIAQLAPFFEIKPEEFDKTFAINVKSIINVSQIVAKEWIVNKTGGSIVNISSQASQAALAGHTVYCASKSAVDAITRNMALELGPHNIRVNCVNPTVIMTEMGKIGWSDPIKADTMRAKIPLGRFGEVDEVVDAVLYLLSDKASMINGVALPIDGGFLAT